MRRWIAALCLMLASVPGWSQVLMGNRASNVIPNAVTVRLQPQRALPNFVRYQPGQEIPAAQFEQYLQEIGLRGTRHELEETDRTTDQLGHEHVRYAQHYAGFEVAYGMLISHAENGRIYAWNGDVFDLGVAPYAPAVTESAALATALRPYGNLQPVWEDAGTRSQMYEPGELRRTASGEWVPRGELMWVPQHGDPERDAFRLAYRFDLYFDTRDDHPHRTHTYVDALTGQRLYEDERIHSGDTLNSGLTRYSGTRSFTADYTGTEFRLRQQGRGQGIETYDMENGTNYGNAVDFTSPTPIWANPSGQEVAVDAHWAAEKYYDYLQNVHGRSSIDNNGFPLISYVHYDRGYFNAFWNGRFATFGDGGSLGTSSGGPLVSIDISAHEFSHGLTGQTAGLIYRNESGALNESFSDIFGKAVEYYAKPNDFDWLVGGDIGAPLRNMARPGQFGDPSVYLGGGWVTGSFDNGGVHSNSGVQNHWFYLLTKGDTGINTAGTAYAVPKLGWDSAEAVAFRNLTVYLTPSSDYADARFYSIQSAIDLYGNCSFPQEAVIRAWYAVGVGSDFTVVPQVDFVANRTTTCEQPYTIEFTEQTTGAAGFVWYFGDGDSSLKPNPTHTYTAPGNYTVTLAVDGVCGVNGQEVKQQYIQIVSSPAPPTVSDASISCRQQTQLIAQVNHEAYWYGPDDVLLHVGDTFFTPPLSQSAQYTVVQVQQQSPQYVGVAQQAVNGSFGNTDFNYMEFDVLEELVISSVKIYAQYAGNRLIELRDKNDNLLAQRAIFADQGSNRVALGFRIPAGIDYRLKVSGQVGLYVESNANYPYEIPGMVRITGNNRGNNFYYYFYDWEVRRPACVSVPRSIEVLVSPPPTPMVGDESRCGPGTLTLAPSLSDSTLLWYDAGQNLVHTGGMFVTPTLGDTATYVVERWLAPAPQRFGPARDTIGQGLFHSYRYEVHLEFTVIKPVKLRSVWVNAQNAGDRVIELRDGEGTLLQQLRRSLPAGPSRVDLDLDLEPGRYRLGGVEMDLKANNTGVNYPYRIEDLIEINTSSDGPSVYFYFYDWIVQEPECRSDPVFVNANVAPGPSSVFGYEVNGLSVNFRDSSVGAIAQVWDFGDGQTSTDRNPTHLYAQPGVYTVTLATSDGSCQNISQQSVEAIGPATHIDGLVSDWQLQMYPNPGTGTVQLRAIASVASQWTVEVFDATGRRVISPQSQARADLHLTLDLSDRPAGVYLVRVAHREGTAWLRYVKR